MSVYLKLNDLENRLSAAEYSIENGVTNSGDLTITGQITAGNNTSINTLNGYSIFKDNEEYSGISLTNLASTVSTLKVSFIDFRNFNGVPDSNIYGIHNVDGSSKIRFDTTPAGSKDSDRRQQALTIESNGYLTIAGGVNGPSGKRRIVLDDSGNKTVIDGTTTGAVPDSPLTIYTSNASATELNIKIDNQQDQWYLVSGKNGGAAGTGGFAIYNGTPSYTGTGLLIDRNFNVTIAGNLKVANTKGIDFSANTDDETGAGSLSSEILDDYEEGTWTPVYAEDTAEIVGNYGSQLGKYTKIGRVVHIDAYIKFQKTSADTTGSVRITGLPFAQADAEPLASANVAAYGTFANSVIQIRGDVVYTAIALYKVTAASVDPAVRLQQIDLKLTGANTDDNAIRISATYMTA